MKNIEFIHPQLADYELIDSGDGAKLERFGERIVARPEPQAIWRRTLTPGQWEAMAAATFVRDPKSDERGRWTTVAGLPERWTMRYDHDDMHLRMRLALTGFKHVGLFPEQAANWDFIYDTVKAMGDKPHPPKVLNLFAYTGGATLAARSAGAEVTHVDSVKQTVGWARDNMEQSGLDGVRWIVDDAMKFVRREVRRGSLYDGLVLDPPAYGRGPEGEKWVLEHDLDELLGGCARLLRPHGFVVLNLYSMGLSALVARTAVRGHFGAAEASEGVSSGEKSFTTEQFGELYFTDRAGKDLPLGVYYRFIR